VSSIAWIANQAHVSNLVKSSLFGALYRCVEMIAPVTAPKARSSKSGSGNYGRNQKKSKTTLLHLSVIGVKKRLCD
jgi:hypothetical protein